MFLGNTHKISMIASKESIVRDGLVLFLDASNNSSYPGSGTTWYDISGNNRNGTINGNPVFTNEYFDITSDSTYISIPNNGLVPRTNDFTYSCWINFDAVDSLDTIFENGSWTDCLLFRYESTQFTVYSEGALRGTISWPASIGVWVNIVLKRENNIVSCYINNVLVGTPFTMNLDINLANPYLLLMRSQHTTNQFTNGKISNFSIYNRSLSLEEIQQNYNIFAKKFFDGTINYPFASPKQASDLGYADGNYYFRSGSMSSARLMEFKNNYYDNKPWVCAFRSPYNSTATTNAIDLNIPMGGLLVQRDTLDIRAAVYWSTPITYNSVGGSGNNTADSGYSPRRVILGYGGGHGIYNTGQSQCNWPNAAGAIGAGWNGSTCGSFPNGLLWGTGQSNTAVYANMSGVWSHWIYWQ